VLHAEQGTPVAERLSGAFDGIDGVADLAVATGHDTTTYRTDDVVVFHRLDGAGAGWVLKDPDAPAAARPDAGPEWMAISTGLGHLDRMLDTID
jgi:hypothetical protein